MKPNQNTWDEQARAENDPCPNTELEIKDLGTPTQTFGDAQVGDFFIHLEYGDKLCFKITRSDAVTINPSPTLFHPREGIKIRILSKVKIGYTTE